MSEQVDRVADEVQYVDLTGFQRDLLLVVQQFQDSQEDCYGLAIKRELEAHYGSEVNHGRLYPNLDELQSLGLIERGQIDKRTNRYETTERGQHLLEEHYARLRTTLRR